MCVICNNLNLTYLTAITDMMWACMCACVYVVQVLDSKTVLLPNIYDPSELRSDAKSSATCRKMGPRSTAVKPLWRSKP